MFMGSCLATSDKTIECDLKKTFYCSVNAAMVPILFLISLHFLFLISWLEQLVFQFVSELQSFVKSFACHLAFY